MKKILGRIGIALAALFLLIQLVPVARTNPPVQQDMPAPAEVKAILRTSCYDCHSNETHWEMPAYVAPFSWLITSDVNEGRKELNFSTWNPAGEEAAEAPAEILEAVTSGEMPPKLYFVTHSEARLTTAQIEILRNWASQASGGALGEGSRRGGRGGESEEGEHDDDD